jgi:hypothetical protein
MHYRIDKLGLLERIGLWNTYLKRKVHLIACGGTAMTLMGVKDSTKDIDLIIPDLSEHDYLVNILKQLGYKSASGSGWARDDGFIFDLFRGSRIHTTDLLESPLLKRNHVLFKEYEKIYLGILNNYDLIVSKLFRGTSLDIEDCIALIKNKRDAIDLKKLEKRFLKTASFDISEDKLKGTLEHFLNVLKKEGLKNG